MNILITGGAGFIGSHLTAKLVALGYNVTIVDSFTNFSTGDFNLNFNYRKKLIKGAKLIINNASHHSVWKQKYEIIIHLAAIPVINPKSGDFFRVNVLETDRVLQKAKKNGVRKVIFTSSIYAYGSYRGKPYKEEFSLEPEDRYGLSKAFGEYLVRKHFFNREWVIIRTAGVFGFGDHNRRISQRIIENNHQSSKLFLTKGAKRSFIYISDLVDSLVKAVESGVKNEVFNITGYSVLLEEFAHEAKRYFPDLQWDLREIPQGEISIGPADIKKAQKLLNFKLNYSIKKGIKDYIFNLQQNIHNNR